MLLTIDLRKLEESIANSMEYHVCKMCCHHGDWMSDKTLRIATRLERTQHIRFLMLPILRKDNTCTTKVRSRANKLGIVYENPWRKYDRNTVDVDEDFICPTRTYMKQIWRGIDTGDHEAQTHMQIYDPTLVVGYEVILIVSLCVYMQVLIVS